MTSAPKYASNALQKLPATTCPRSRTRYPTNGPEGGGVWGGGGGEEEPSTVDAGVDAVVEKKRRMDNVEDTGTTLDGLIEACRKRSKEQAMWNG